MITGSQAGYIFVLGCIGAVIWTLCRLRSQKAEDNWEPQEPSRPTTLTADEEEVWRQVLEDSYGGRDG